MEKASKEETRDQSQQNLPIEESSRTPLPPLWAAGIGALVLGILYAALPDKVTIGPSWLPLLLEVLVLLPLFLARLLRRPLPHSISRTLSFALLGIVTLALSIGVLLMVLTLHTRTTAQAEGLLRIAALLWLANVLVFALWYWEIDGGGPLKRHHAGNPASDLMFPQQAMPQGKRPKNWAPHFLDYLFVAFTTATALSPADTMPLTRKAKALMMLEALISMMVILLLAARAINIL